MGSNAVAGKAKLKIAALVRNNKGQPQFNDWNSIPEQFHKHLSVEDWEYIEQQRKT
jgi:hypothetical protein